MKIKANRFIRVTFGHMILLMGILSVLLIQTFKVDTNEYNNTNELSNKDIGKPSLNNKYNYAQYNIPEGYDGPFYLEDFFESESNLMGIQSEFTVTTTCEGFIKSWAW